METREESPWALQVEDLTVAYDIEPVLWDVDLDIPRGSLTAVIGPNGAGKSTLIKAVLKLVRTVAGEVRIHSERVAYVPQSGSVTGIGAEALALMPCRTMSGGDATKALKEAMDNGSVEDINNKSEALMNAAGPVMQKAYNKMSGDQAAGGSSAGSNNSAPKDDNVVDANFQEVKDDDK